MSEGTLSSLRVLDLSRVLAGPFCSQILGDYGADVVKVEEPRSGDGTRGWGPPWAGKQSAYFLSANRNKRSLCIDLHQSAGRDLVAALATRADILIENFRPGAMARMGLDYAVLGSSNPRLIYCSISGYGQSGPYRDRPGYDFVIQAEGGLMSITGPEDGPASKVGVAIVDVCAGLYASSAILAALHERQRSGKGQSIDIALYDTQLAILANVAQNYLVTGQPPRSYGNAHASIVPYQPFKTSDGEIAVAIGSDEQYRRFCESVNIQDLAAGELSRNEGRVIQRKALTAALQTLFLTRTSSEWLELLASLAIPSGPMRDIAAAVEDPHTQARGMVQRTGHATAGELRVIGPVAHFARTPAGVRLPPPLLGQHTDEVLREWLGASDVELNDLRQSGTIA